MGKGSAEAGRVNMGPATETIRKAVEVFQRQSEVGLHTALMEQSEGIQTLSPFMATATDAMDEMRQFLGMAPVSKTEGLATRLSDLEDQFSYLPFMPTHTWMGAGDAVKNFHNAVRNAEEETDPARRAGAMKAALDAGDSAVERLRGDFAFAGQRSDSMEVRHEMGLMAPIMREVEKTYDEFKNQYEVEQPQPYTAAEVTQKLEELPEYQFQLEQGTKAMQRSQAARGMLGSGNALIEAQEFGQGLAQNVYQGHLSRLAGMAGMYLPTAQQTSSQQAGLGQYAGNYQLQGSTSRMGTMTEFAKMQTQAAIAQAQMETQASIANSQGGGGGLGGIFKGVTGLLGGLF